MEAFYFKARVISKRMTGRNQLAAEMKYRFLRRLPRLTPSWWCVCGFWWIWWVGHPGAAHQFSAADRMFGQVWQRRGPAPERQTEKHELQARQRDAGEHLHEQRNLNPCLLPCWEAEAGR